MGRFNPGDCGGSGAVAGDLGTPADPTEERVPGSILIERLGEFNTLGMFLINDGTACVFCEGDGSESCACAGEEFIVGPGGPGAGFGFVLNKDLLLL